MLIKQQEWNWLIVNSLNSKYNLEYVQSVIGISTQKSDIAGIPGKSLVI